MDFPASPTAGQLFISPTNGVVYQWSTTYTAWLPLSVTGAGQGDFCYTTSGTLDMTGGGGVLLFNSLLSGNAGGWYNASSGRFTPPAGRYVIYSLFTVFNGGGTSGNATLRLRKNGTNVTSSQTQSIASGQVYFVEVKATLDANGTDYFDIWAITSASQAQSGPNQAIFGAFPITGAAQPAGTGSAWRQIGRVVPTAGLASVDFQNLPSDINDLRLHFDVTPTANAVDLLMQFYDGSGALDTTSGHYNFNNVLGWSSQTAGQAAGNWSGTAISLSIALCLTLGVATDRVNNSATGGVRGRLSISNIRDTARVKSAQWQVDYLNDTAIRLDSGVGSGWRNVAGAITGLRLVFNTTTFAAGGAVTLWGSP
jgi:hypothetical protein